MRTLLFSAALLALGFAAGLKATPNALDPVRVAPHIYELAFENERVRVLKRTIRHGETACSGRRHCGGRALTSSQSGFAPLALPHPTRETEPTPPDPAPGRSRPIFRTDSEGLVLAPGRVLRVALLRR